ncbi:MAG: hypothetical protein IT245_00995 [Bacteroidia bacterium]|nr:hypothetical protein [Bacteroidia bacterium]
MALLKPFQLAIVCEILEGYKYDKPFGHHFSSMAKLRRNWGSKDRKTYRNACYAYFRLGKSVIDLPLNEAVLKAWSIFNGEAILDNPVSIFPDSHLISPLIDQNKWLESHLHQKPVYFVMRRGYEKECADFLNEENIPFEIYDNLILKLPPESKADFLTDKAMAWVMDRASAELANKVEILDKQIVWDACSGAGGKSLFLTQKYNQKFTLICSDLRFSILENLKSRFYTLGFNLPQIEVTDLTEAFQISKLMDIIVLDVPCTGSGTWGRTPENIRNFDVLSIQKYAKLQRNITSNAVKNLKADGTLYYMTCSVFSDENEANLELIMANHKLKLLESSYVHFGHDQTDTLFYAKLQKIN